MSLQSKFGFAAAAILATTLGVAGLTHAAPLAGGADTIIAVQRTQSPAEADGLIQKVHHKGKMEVHHHHHHHHHHHPAK
ncbi:MAG: hypothetical protein ACREC0_07220 [Methylocella sp.]